MGLEECLCFTLIAGLFPLFFGLYILMVGKVYLTSFSKRPITGGNARHLGLLCILFTFFYYVVFFWAWSHAPP